MRVDWKEDDYGNIRVTYPKDAHGESKTVLIPRKDLGIGTTKKVGDLAGVGFGVPPLATKTVEVVKGALLFQAVGGLHASYGHNADDMQWLKTEIPGKVRISGVRDCRSRAAKATSSSSR